jgi:hypothetical protein
MSENPYEPPKEELEPKRHASGRGFREKLNLRDLAWLLLVIALMYGWFLDHQIMLHIIRKSQPGYGPPDF